MTDMNFEWDISPEDGFNPMVDDYIAQVVQDLRTLLEAYAPEIESWMKANAPWMDHTGNARQALYAFIEEAVGEISVVFDHGVFYGRFLELRHAGKYAVIAPALDYFWPRLIADVQRLLS